MNPEKLVRMAEQIAQNVTISSDVDTVARLTAEHLMKFWDPRMREELVAYATESAPALSEAVGKAVRSIGARAS